MREIYGRYTSRAPAARRRYISSLLSPIYLPCISHISPSYLLHISRVSPRQAERSAELAHHMMALFEANRFRGHLEGPARSHRLPLL